MGKKIGAAARGGLKGLASYLDTITALYDIPVGVYDKIMNEPGKSHPDRTKRWFEKWVEKKIDEATGYKYHPAELTDAEKNIEEKANIIAGAASPKRWGQKAALALATDYAGKKLAENVDQSTKGGRAVTALAPLAVPTAVSSAGKTVKNTLKNKIIDKLDPKLVELAKKGDFNPVVTALMDSENPSAKRWQGYLNNIIQQSGGESGKVGIEKFLDQMAEQTTGKKRKSKLNEENAAAKVLKESVSGLNEKWKEPKDLKNKVIESVKSLDKSEGISNVDHADLIARINEKFPNNIFNLKEVYLDFPDEKKGAFIKSLSERTGIKIGENTPKTHAQLNKNDLITPNNTKKLIKPFLRDYGSSPILNDLVKELEKNKGQIPIKRLDVLAKKLNKEIDVTTKEPFFSKKAKESFAAALEQDMKENLQNKHQYIPDAGDLAKDWKKSKTQMSELLSDYPYESQQNLKETSLGKDTGKKNRFVEEEYFGTTKNEKGQNVLNDKGAKPLTELASPDAQKKWLQEYMHSMGFNTDEKGFSPNKFYNIYGAMQEPMQKKLTESHGSHGTSKLNLEELMKLNEAHKGAVREKLNTSGTEGSRQINETLGALAGLLTNTEKSLKSLGTSAAKQLISDSLLYNKEGVNELTRRPNAKDYLPNKSDVVETLRVARNPGTRLDRKSKDIPGTEEDNGKNLAEMLDELF